MKTMEIHNLSGEILKHLESICPGSLDQRIAALRAAASTLESVLQAEVMIAGIQKAFSTIAKP